MVIEYNRQERNFEEWIHIFAAKLYKSRSNIKAYKNIQGIEQELLYFYKNWQTKFLLQGFSQSEIQKNFFSLVLLFIILRKIRTLLVNPNIDPQKRFDYKKKAEFATNILTKALLYFLSQEEYSNLLKELEKIDNELEDVTLLASWNNLFVFSEIIYIVEVLNKGDINAVLKKYVLSYTPEKISIEFIWNAISLSNSENPNICLVSPLSSGPIIASLISNFLERVYKIKVRLDFVALNCDSDYISDPNFPLVDFYKPEAVFDADTVLILPMDNGIEEGITAEGTNRYVEKMHPKFISIPLVLAKINAAL